VNRGELSHGVMGVRSERKAGRTMNLFDNEIIVAFAGGFMASYPHRDRCFEPETPMILLEVDSELFGRTLCVKWDVGE